MGFCICVTKILGKQATNFQQLCMNVKHTLGTKERAQELWKRFVSPGKEGGRKTCEKDTE